MHFIVAFFLIQYAHSVIQHTEHASKWDNFFKYARIIVFSLIATYYIAESPDWFGWIWNLGLLGLVRFFNQNDDFKSIRSTAQSVLPFVGVSMVSDFFEQVFPKFYNSYDQFFQIALSFAFIFCFVIWFYARKQQKVLTQEREERLREEQIAKETKLSLEYLVAERTQELTQQKEELQKTIEELKATQNQLIQSEKMASLGELTAGIAHEIQNPLNFVNNFSEVSVELCQELEEEIEKTNIDDNDKEYIKGIIGDLSQNQQKITHHGKRADSIVKGMLQHSRASSGEKEPVDVNALADEYMRLAYHGLRAKDKEFNAALVTDFDGTIGTVNVLPQDLGRVFLNLFTNAFYAVAEKKRKLTEAGQLGDYKPEVKISTKKFDNKLYIRVSDNGTGMPEHVKAKIFQPFFTTKPTGQGTGLGLSMSYDIITNGHGGVLEVDTVEGEKTEFRITIPIA
ncbi:signal transduction histidine kinase [Dyadobacter sp. BE34]|uniref:histidine kinase n=1 Tax=Dyadobacter fermentans TaxID=94254 RepID=A0ABU1QX73_9BACT|nr:MULTISPECIES: ATP-binding protein [Dyadobacter]MDR6805755.1 signal transduction histidine kinase [Dyadobacter fermentans]MDR7042485.1 signal transduction histidine kinase [Dyadobacter sp. BE242]MDR7196797.1 signal transduction histidine kinase [Dyadobacter sp. BE34]MDR7215768.1 signal transduction histidine kinase [Dyadobacter sp. BE31]MDR7263304.1 signal transduction histidine kinase [Dyadobacter sp. BE32]